MHFAVITDRITTNTLHNPFALKVTFEILQVIFFLNE